MYVHLHSVDLVELHDAGYKLDFLVTTIHRIVDFGFHCHKGINYFDVYVIMEKGQVKPYNKKLELVYPGFELEYVKCHNYLGSIGFPQYPFKHMIFDVTDHKE
jgi:hypothetical protein